MNAISYSNSISSKSQFSQYTVFEKTTYLLSAAGSFFLILYFIIVAPYYLEYRALENLGALHLFSAKYGAELYNITDLLALAAIFTCVGLFLGSIHKNKTINITNFVCLLCIVIIWIPSMMMVIVD